MARAKYKPAEGDYDAGNDIKGYKECNGDASQGKTESSGTAAKKPSSAPAEPGWAKKDEPAEETPKKAPPAKKAPPKKEPEEEPEMELVLIGAGTDYTLEEWHDADYTDEDLVNEGYAEWREVKKAAPAKKAPPKKGPAKKAAPAKEEEVAEPAGKKAPPWAK